METVMVEDLMVPLEEYATVSEEATLFDAVMALEKAQERLDRERYHYLHRAILVLDENKRVIGKVSQLDALRTLEPKYAEMGDFGTVSRAGFSPQFMKSMLEQYALLSGSLEDICRRAAKIYVKEFMYTPKEGEYIEKGSYLNQAIHQFLMGHHQSLLVTSDQEIVGILRLTDVFKHVFQIMKTCVE